MTSYLLDKGTMNFFGRIASIITPGLVGCMPYCSNLLMANEQPGELRFRSGQSFFGNGNSFLRNGQSPITRPRGVLLAR